MLEIYQWLVEICTIFSNLLEKDNAKLEIYWEMSENEGDNGRTFGKDWEVNKGIFHCNSVLVCS